MLCKKYSGDVCLKVVGDATKGEKILVSRHGRDHNHACKRLGVVVLSGQVCEDVIELIARSSFSCYDSCVKVLFRGDDVFSRSGLSACDQFCEFDRELRIRTHTCGQACGCDLVLCREQFSYPNLLS